MKTSDDPRSYYYKREYNKAKINFKKLILYLLAYFALLISFIKFRYNIVYFLFFIIILLLFTTKNLLIFIVKLYQHIAPISIRSKCRFEPSCSDYMLICLQKYGLINGLKKGLNRLKRCNINDGGYDEP